jgi:hypothetical protein
LRRIRSTLWAHVVEAKLLDLARALKANFDPNQPRVPAGNSDGGEWTRTGTGSATSNTQVAQNPSRGGRSSGQVRLRGGQVVEATPAQEARLAIAQARAARAISQVRELDPNWRPTPSLTKTIEGEISAAEAEAREAEARLAELAREEPDSLIDAYRRQQGLDLLGDPIWSREQNSVAVCKVGEQPFLGVNSQALTYTDSDNASAERLRDTLVKSYPATMNTTNIGRFPNDALFHAETTCLLRAARANGGTLAGKTIKVTVDREMCPSCKKLLPLIGLELGNPTVTFVDRSGRVRTMRNGTWKTGR